MLKEERNDCSSSLFCVLANSSKRQEIFGTQIRLGYEHIRERLSKCVGMPVDEIPAGVEEEMDVERDGFVSAENVLAWINTNVDWYTGQQAMSKFRSSAALFNSSRVLFAVFGFDYAQPFTRMNIVGSYSIGMAYLLLLSKPIDSDLHARNQAEGAQSGLFVVVVDLLFRCTFAGRILYMLMDGGKHPTNLQPYLERVVEDMVTLELKGHQVGENLWRKNCTFFFMFVSTHAFNTVALANFVFTRRYVLDEYFGGRSCPSANGLQSRPQFSRARVLLL